MVVGGVVFCLAAAAGALWYTRGANRQAGIGANGASVANATKQEQKPGPTYSFQPFIVNVAGTDGTRYLKASISVECADKKASADIAAVEYKVRDAVIAVLSACDLDELTDVSRRDAIRSRVAEAIERALPGDDKRSPRVRGVYFLEFVIQ
jgi:flagellar FliL protein